MKKILVCLLIIAMCLFVAGCEKKCAEGYVKENDKCVMYTEMLDALLSYYVCDFDDEWQLEGTECVKGVMPPIGDGCEEGTTDRIGEDGFCHHYMDATLEYKCDNNYLLKDNKCYDVKEAQ